MATSDRISRLDEALARDTGVSVPALRAIRQVESGGNARAIRFETRVFNNRTGQTVQGHDRAAFQRAYAINPLEAVNSTSWGWFQVMGFHGFPAMYGGPAQAVRAFDADPEAVSLALFKKWMSKPAARTAKAAAARLDFATFASVYNGCALPCERYSTRMRAAYERALPEWEEYLRNRPGSIALWVTLAGGALAGVGYYFYRRKKRTGSFFGGVQEDVEDVIDGASDAFHDSFWVGGPGYRSKGGEDGPRDYRRGASKLDRDRSGKRVITIIDDYDCNDLNRSIKKMQNAKDGFGRLLAKYPDPEVFDKVRIYSHPEEPDVEFGPETVEWWEEQLDERIGVLRSLARANGCSQVAGFGAVSEEDEEEIVEIINDAIDAYFAGRPWHTIPGKPYADYGKDSSGTPWVKIREELDCGELNHSINRLLEAGRDLDRKVLSRASEIDWENLPMELDESSEKTVRQLRADLDEEVDVARRMARANGCTQIAGLRRR